MFRLLCVEPAQRLSVMDLMNHPWLHQDKPFDVPLETPSIITANEVSLKEKAIPMFNLIFYTRIVVFNVYSLVGYKISVRGRGEEKQEEQH